MNWRLIIAGTVLAFVSGCGSGPDVTLEDAGVFHHMPAGKVAVLEATSAPTGEAKGYKYVWGLVHPPAAEFMLAEICAYFAREEGGLDVIPPPQAEKQLDAADLDFTLQPTREEMDTFARTLGCSTYLSIQIDRWGFHYIMWKEKAVLEVVIRCYVPGEIEPLWTARVEHSAKQTSERELAIEAMRATFKKLAARDGQ